MRYVVGYVPNHRGIEAVNLAVTLAGSRDVTLDIVVVLPVEEPTFDMYSPDRAYQAALDEQGRGWLDQALAQVPEGVTARGLVRNASSITQGLIEAATDPELGEEAEGIVIGASHRGLLGYFTIGSIASALLHASPVPVALAPGGYESQGAVSRVTAAMGQRQGADALLEVAIGAAASRQVPLRLMSLVALDHDEASDGDRARIESAERHEEHLVAKAGDRLDDVSGVVGSGKTLEDCVGTLEFNPDEIVLLGSSRLGGPKKVFLGASANKILRALTVPMVVVPLDYEVPSV